VLASWQGLAMNRAVVLIVCLLGAAGITAYSHGQRDMGVGSAAVGGSDQGDVYVVPQRNPLPAPKPPAETATVTPAETPADRIALVRSLQFELKRVGCYSGEINGVWTTSSRMAMKSFTDRVNASLPIDNPDQVLLSLVKGHQDQACPGGTTRAAKSEDGDGRTGALVAGGAAAAGAAAAMAVSRPDAKADDRPRRVSATPDGSAAGPSKGPQQDAAGGAKSSGPVPPEGIKDKAKSKQAKKPASQQPKFVRDFLKALGIKQ
jgi:hypothetical protein